MSKYFKYFEYAYLFFAALFLFEAVRIWSEEPSKAYLFLFFVVVAVGMYFFKRRFRKKYEQRNQN
ncbi:MULTISPECIES: hypothetical protein [Leeuwenhoekiella]|uniref:Uncharacterized protein n=1 Tax=Leeuwenhoekiella nanhaiensis TaxID=1655491 RepID=A0A2G1VN25_9FLAO|nr:MULTISPECIES: hypothetical protein [Leeuwenhoekiella]MAW97167.1 hypothetical protein [Leeuwenhoekiella sp.]MBA82747.1 hypothetical protein [Leeuwenhoekiella sp.]PHQ28163.1 hypothetical protein CJ305_16125 [Leeuwenhoekiella nanhaiensis]|tara:strand:- start:1438 stop:1632 length:195 start_codon:yes stop_codon:yes gene_type:complete